MKITLHQLNDSYQALVRLANKEYPKEAHKLAYRLSRIYKQAKNEIETISDSLNALMAKVGFAPGERNIDPALINEFNTLSKKFLKETEVEFAWGEPIPFKEIAEHVSISPADRAELDWLLIEEEEKPRATKQAAA